MIESAVHPEAGYRFCCAANTRSPEARAITEDDGAMWSAGFPDGEGGVTPRHLPSGSFTPAVSVCEAHCDVRLSGESAGGAVRRFCVRCAPIQTAITSNRGRPTPKVRCAPPRIARGSRLPVSSCKAWGVGVRETLTASRPSAAIWQLRDGRKTRPSRPSRDGDAQPVVNLQRIGVLDVQTPCAGNRFPPWTTRAG